ncbi:MAG: hypothetical protein ACYDBQ_04095 [Thermoplasmatota archaeon]
MASLARLLAGRMRMLKEDAVAVAHVVEDAFRGQAEVDDDSLGKDVRQVFYDLQNEKILDVRRDEVREDGQARRHYYWRLRDGDVPFAEEPPRPDATERLYGRLPESSWERRHVDDLL